MAAGATEAGTTGVEDASSIAGTPARAGDGAARTRLSHTSPLPRARVAAGATTERHRRSRSRLSPGAHLALAANKLDLCTGATRVRRPSRVAPPANGSARRAISGCGSPHNLLLSLLEERCQRKRAARACVPEAGSNAQGSRNKKNFLLLRHVSCVGELAFCGSVLRPSGRF